jgi:hypothetical protein
MYGMAEVYPAGGRGKRQWSADRPGLAKRLVNSSLVLPGWAPLRE